MKGHLLGRSSFGALHQLQWAASITSSSAGSIETQKTTGLLHTHGAEAKIVWLDLKESLSCPEFKYAAPLCPRHSTVLAQKTSSYFLALVFFSSRRLYANMCMRDKNSLVRIFWSRNKPCLIIKRLHLLMRNRLNLKLQFLKHNTVYFVMNKKSQLKYDLSSKPHTHTQSVVRTHGCHYWERTRKRVSRTKFNTNW